LVFGSFPSGETNAVADSFDPYLNWLGIRDPQRPPNHYRLLGIDLFENDPAIIANAADRQMAHIRTFQSGVYGALSQQILNELATARVCLLKPEKKAAYDAQLQAQQKPASPQPRFVPVQVAQAVPSGAAKIPSVDVSNWNAQVASTRTSAAATRPKRKQQSSAAPWIVMGALVLSVVTGGLYLWQRSNRPTIAASTGGPAVPEDRKVVPKPSKVASESSPQNEGKAPQVAQQVSSPPTPPRAADSEKLREPVPKFAPTAVSPEISAAVESFIEADEEQPTAEESKSPVVEQLTPSNATSQELPRVSDQKTETRVAIPSEAEQKQSLAKIREIFGDELQQSKTPSAQAGLAQKLLTQAIETNNDPTAEYVMLNLACDQAVLAADAPLARKICDRLNERFAVDGLVQMADALVKINKKAKVNASRDSLMPIAQELLDKAISTEAYDAGDKLSRTLVQIASKSRDKDAIKLAASRDKEFKEIQKAYRTAIAAEERLARQPYDGSAHLQIGEYLCFVRNDWQHGVLHWTNAGDAALA
jgi:hypothetical protein